MHTDFIYTCTYTVVFLVRIMASYRTTYCSVVQYGSKASIKQVSVLHVHYMEHVCDYLPLFASASKSFPSRSQNLRWRSQKHCRSSLVPHAEQLPPIFPVALISKATSKRTRRTEGATRVCEIVFGHYGQRAHSKKWRLMG